jgi:hypothetical protein
MPGEHLKLEVNPGRRPFAAPKVCAIVSYTRSSAPMIASEHDGKGAQMGNARDDIRSCRGARPTSCRHRHRLLHHLMCTPLVRPLPYSTTVERHSFYRAMRTAKESESTHSIKCRFWRASTALCATARCSKDWVLRRRRSIAWRNSPDPTMATAR